MVSTDSTKNGHSIHGITQIHSEHWIWLLLHSCCFETNELVKPPFWNWEWPKIHKTFCFIQYDTKCGTEHLKSSWYRSDVKGPLSHRLRSLVLIEKSASLNYCHTGFTFWGQEFLSFFYAVYDVVQSGVLWKKAIAFNQNLFLNLPD